MTDRDLLLAIQELLDGREWNAETTSIIAELLRENGYPVLDLNPDERW